MKLQEVRDEFAKYIILKDPWALDMVLATVIGNAFIDRDPIWTALVAPSSGGKSTLIAPLVGLSSVHFVDDVTEKTFLSGYKVKGKDMSLLSLIGKNGVIAFSDFTSILSKNPVSRGEILTQLKLIYDGKMTKHTGTGSGAWDGKIGLIAASTPDIYSQLESGRSMGERFMYYSMNQPTDEEIEEKQNSVRMSSKAITEVMKLHYKDYCVSVRDFITENDFSFLRITPEQRARIKNAAIFAVNGKATVHTDHRTGKVDEIPNKASIGRDNKMFDALLLTLQAMDAFEHDDPVRDISDDRISMIEKCAYSSITRERRKILEVLAYASDQQGMTASAIGAQDGLGLDKQAIEKYLWPLHAVGMVSKLTTGAHKWYIKDEHTREFVMKVSKDVMAFTNAQGLEINENEDGEETDSGDPGKYDDDEYGDDQYKVDKSFDGV